MITICRNLCRHCGQGVVWNGLHGPVKGHIEYAVQRFSHPDRQVTFIVLGDSGNASPEEKTASMLYPNMKAWLKWKANIVRTNIENLRESRFDARRRIAALVENAWDTVLSSYGTLGFSEKMNSILEELSGLVSRRGVTMPLCDTVRDEDLMAELEAELRQLTKWERRLEKKHKAHEEWKKKQEANNGEV